MKAIHLSIAAITTALVMAPAGAAPGDRDIRCMLLSNLFAKAAPDPRGKEAAGQVRLFYLGRVSAKFSPAQMQAAMAVEAKSISPAQAGPEMNKCAASVQASAAAAEAVGTRARATVTEK